MKTTPMQFYSTSLRSIAFSVAATSLLMLGACTSKTSKTSSSDSSTTKSTTIVTDTAKQPTAIKPTGAAPAWAPDIKPEMQAVIEKLASYGDKPIETLTPAEARKNHTPTDAVKDLMAANNIAAPIPKCDTTGKDIPVDGGTIHLRIYTPKPGNGPFPVIVYFHGGGFVIADLDVYNASAQAFSDEVGAVVVSVAYRLAPEHKFPTAHKDAFTAYQWVLNNAASIKGDPKMIAVAGESAGGNLAANVSIMARDNKIMIPVHQVLIYPVANSDMMSASYVKNANAKPLNKAMMAWFVKYYLNNMAQAKDPRISLVNANLKGLPPTTLITDEIDPLQSEGMLLGDKLKAAGVTVDSKNYDGVTHEFFGMGTIVPQAKDAETFAFDQLKKAFKK
jgi:acetyl esterase